MDILYEDNDLLVVNKPSGLLTHPVSPSAQSESLVSVLQDRGTTLSDVAGDYRAGIVHRLDRFTDGLMVVAKTNDAHQELARQFKNREVTKKYYAMVYGNVQDDERIIEKTVGRHAHRRMKMTTTNIASGLEKTASTKIKVLRRYNTKTLLEVSPKTGRTHQIRVHLAAIGHAVLGDPLYGKRKPQTRGQLLQSFYLGFTHPTSGKALSFELPLSDRLKAK